MPVCLRSLTLIINSSTPMSMPLKVDLASANSRLYFRVLVSLYSLYHPPSSQLSLRLLVIHTHDIDTLPHDWQTAHLASEGR